MRRIVFYIRISTDGQDKAETDENQLRDLYKVYNKTDVVKVYKDTGSGADPDRQDLKALLADSRKKMFDVVAVWDSSRLARDVKLFLIIKDELKENGVKIEIMGKEREDSDSGRLLEIIEAAVDEMERGRIKRRFISGRERRLSEGKLIGCYSPFGYNHIRRNREKGTDAYFEINEKETKIVRKIFKWYLELESIFLVTKRLKEKNIKTRGKDGEPKFFCCSMVSKILRRETYIGKHYFGKTSPCIAKYHLHKVRKHRLTGRRINPKSEWRMVEVTPIIDIDIFNRAQEIIKSRAKFALKESKYEFLTQGIVKCIDCNRHYGGRIQGNYLIYRCPQHYGSNPNHPICRSRSISANKLDIITWAYVSSLINDKEKIKQNVRILREKRENDKSSNKKILESLLSEKDTLKVKKGKLFELYTNDKIQMGDLEMKMGEFDERERLVNAQIAEIKRELKDIEDIKSIEGEIEKTCLAYQEKVANPSFELKKYIVRKWVEEIYIEKDGSIKIKVRVPQGETIKETKKEFLYSLPNPILQEESQVSLRFEEVINTK